MIVRIMNKKNNTDKLLECHSAGIFNFVNDEQRLVLDFNLLGLKEVNLFPQDEIYYMNNEGKTINSDFRMLK